MDLQTLCSSSIKLHLPPWFWEGAAPTQKEYVAVLRKVLNAFHCQVEILISSFTVSHLGAKNWKLFELP